MQPLKKITQEEAYNKFTGKIEDLEADPGREMKSVLISKEYQNLFAGWFGCEVISLYVTPELAHNREDTARKQIEFLESTPGALNFPMYTINDSKSTGIPFSDIKRVNKKTIDNRREAQKKLLKTPDERTSAELCAKYLQIEGAPSFLLLPFGEILTYCYIYHILEKVAKKQNKTDLNWDSIGTDAWKKIVEKYQERPNVTKKDVESDLLNALKNWYFHPNKKDNYDREYMASNRIQAVYNLPMDVNLLLKNLDHTNIVNENLNEFLKEWARNLYETFLSETEGEDLRQIFRNKSLINPTIEELLCTRGLYITIIRSPLNRSNLPPSPLSQAYAICTIFDTSFLEDFNRRKSLDHLLCRLAYTDLAQYDYQKLERIRNNQNQIQELFSTVSNSNYDWQMLMNAAGETSLQISKAEHVLVSYREIGTLFLSKDSKSKKDNPIGIDDMKATYLFRWFNDISGITSHCNNKVLWKSLEEGILSIQLIDVNPSPAIKLLKRISQKLGISARANLEVRCFPVGDENSDKRAGIIILFIQSMATITPEMDESLNKIALALSIGMKMPFRSMINKGLISWLIRNVIHFWYNVKTFKFSLPIRQPSPRISIQQLIDRALATMLEFTQIGFMLIGVTFLYFVFNLLYHSHTGNIITETLKNVEKTVMAFSICLAATGIMFLMKPEIAYGQPKWMKKFAKPGTLEQTLIKLAALVLTIDVLSVILQLQESLKSSDTYLWILVKPAMFHLLAYLVVLLGLAFLFETLFKEQPEIEEETDI